MTDLDKDDGRTDGHETVEFAENLVLLLLIRAVHVHLRDALDREILLAKLHLVGVRRKAASVDHHLIREGGGEEKNLDRLGEKTGERELAFPRVQYRAPCG